MLIGRLSGMLWWTVASQELGKMKFELWLATGWLWMHRQHAVKATQLILELSSADVDSSELY